MVALHAADLGKPLEQAADERTLSGYELAESVEHCSGRLRGGRGGRRGGLAAGGLLERAVADELEPRERRDREDQDRERLAGPGDRVPPDEQEQQRAEPEPHEPGLIAQCRSDRAACGHGDAARAQQPRSEYQEQA